jgi:hypothetical protein
MKRHDPQNLRLFPQPVKRTERNFASAGLKPGPPGRSGKSPRDATNLTVSCTEGTESAKREGVKERFKVLHIVEGRVKRFEI